MGAAMFNKYVYVFDIDGTLFASKNGDKTIYISGQPVSVTALRIMKLCVKNNYYIGINTARNKMGAMMASPVIRACFNRVGYRYEPGFFDLNGYGPFQYGHQDKGIAMEKIRKFYGIRNKRHMILFDDRNYNLNLTRQRGFNAVSSCGDDYCPNGMDWN